MENMVSTRSLLLAFAAACVLTACGNVRDDLGLGRASPDEFAVVDRPPLSMPPDFGLRPPQPGAPRPQEVDMTQRANNILFGADPNPAAAEAASPPASGSDSEKALLASANTAGADPNIRATIDREAAAKVKSSAHLIDQILWWHENTPPAATVDSAKEAARIREAKDKGEPVNKGATPVIERQKSGWLGL